MLQERRAVFSMNKLQPVSHSLVYILPVRIRLAEFALCCGTLLRQRVIPCCGPLTCFMFGTCAFSPGLGFQAVALATLALAASNLPREESVKLLLADISIARPCQVRRCESVRGPPPRRSHAMSSHFLHGPHTLKTYRRIANFLWWANGPY